MIKMIKYLINNPINLRYNLKYMILPNRYDYIQDLLMSYLIFVRPFIKCFVSFIIYFEIKGFILNFKSFGKKFSIFK